MKYLSGKMVEKQNLFYILVENEKLAGETVIKVELHVAGHKSCIWKHSTLMEKSLSKENMCNCDKCNSGNYLFNIEKDKIFQEGGRHNDGVDNDDFF